MAWMSDYTDMKAVQGRAQQAMGLPLGMASPLWLAFGAATTAGVAWWLMTRWTQALNVEALAVAEAAQPVEIVGDQGCGKADRQADGGEDHDGHQEHHSLHRPGETNGQGVPSGDQVAAVVNRFLRESADGARQPPG